MTARPPATDPVGARLLGRLAEQIAALAQLVDDLATHRDQLRQAGNRAGLAALPSSDQLAAPLLSLRQIAKGGRR